MKAIMLSFFIAFGLIGVSTWSASAEEPWDNGFLDTNGGQVCSYGAGVGDCG